MNIKKYKLINYKHFDFDKIDNVIYNLNNQYNLINDMMGGGDNDKKSNKYYIKYKNLIKSSEKSIKHYKKFAQEQIAKQMQMNQYYGNLVQMLNSQKEYLFNEYLKMGRNVNANKDKINMLETMINGIEKYMKSPVEFENVVNKIVLKGGFMTFDVFESNITNELQQLEKHVNEIDENRKYVDTKVSELHDKMKKIIEENEQFRKIKIEIDWMVKELENKDTNEIMEAQNFEELYEKLMGIIKKTKEYEPNKSIVEYIQKLEEYAEYLENFIKSNEQTMDTMDFSKKQELKKHIAALQEQEGGNKYHADYDEKKKKKNLNIMSYLKKKYDHIELVGLTIEPPAEPHDAQLLNNIDTEQNNYIVLVGQIQQLNYIISNFFNLIIFLKNNIELLKTDDGKKIIELWSNIFSKKNTDFYNNQILKYKILFLNEDVETFQDALVKIHNVNDTDKLKIKVMVIDEEYLKKIDKTIVAFDYLNFFLFNFALGLMKLYDDKNDLIQHIEKYIPMKQQFLHRSGELLKFYDYSKILTENDLSLIEYRKFNNELGELKKYDDVDKDTLYNFIGSYSANLMHSVIDKDEKSVLDKVNLEQMKILSSLANMLNRLYDKIVFKLTGNSEVVTKVGENFETYSALLNSINSPILSQQAGADPCDKPRLTPFETKLNECKGNMKPYVIKVEQLKQLISKTLKQTLAIDETKALFKLSTKLKQIVENSINSYIQVIPMLFFTIEYPPDRYKDDKTKYVFSYDQKLELVKNKLEGYADDEEQKDDVVDEDALHLHIPSLESFNSHAAFLKSNNQNSTKNVITDPIIGLDKLLNIQNDKDKPLNNIMNMMFAFGASGTGKTTRYFGVEDANPDDKKGIIPYIIEKGLEKNSTNTDEDKISIAYFVSYGRLVDNQIKEILLFFNVGKVIEEKEDEEHKYTPYILKEEEQEDEINYTNFYLKLTTKKLYKCKFENVNEFITNGTDYAEPPVEENKTFRDIIKLDEIWYNVKDKNSLKDTFNKLLNEQKKINTIMPTKNNIESSRGHTCVLIRIKDGTTYRYFPLFDMGGTEDSKKMKEFLFNGNKLEEMAKLILQINKFTQTEKLKGAKEIGSLKELVESEEKVKTLFQTGGNNISKMMILDMNVVDANKLLTKIVDEGPYINHTIGMTIFAAMCVAESLQTCKRDTDDEFDNLGTKLFEKVKNYTCLYKKTEIAEDGGEEKEEECTNKPKLIIEKYDFKSILNSSCIWLNILFTFLYWNSETQESTTEWLKSDKEPKSYINDMQEFDFVENIPVKYAELLKNVNYDFKTIEETLTKSFNFDITHTQKNDTVRVKINIESFYIDESANYMLKLSYNLSRIKYELTVNVSYYILNNLNNDFKQNINTLYNQIKDAEKGKIIQLICKFYDTEESKHIDKFVKINKTNKPQIIEQVYNVLLWLEEKKIKIGKTVLNEIPLIKDDKLIHFLRNGYQIHKYDKNFVFYKNGKKIDKNVTEIIDLAKNIPDMNDSENITIKNQMLRIKDSRSTATKMVLMHLITGQEYKKDLVSEIINLVKNMYDATNISFVSKEQDGGYLSNKMYVNYKEKYLKYKNKYLKLKYSN